MLVIFITISHVLLIMQMHICVCACALYLLTKCNFKGMIENSFYSECSGFTIKCSYWVIGEVGLDLETLIHHNFKSTKYN